MHQRLQMSVPFAKCINALVSKTTPEPIFQYTPGRLLRVSTVGFSLVFFAYGATFVDWSYHSSLEVWRSTDDETRASWEFRAKTFSPWALSLIPFSVAATALYIPSRVVTKVTYIPRPRMPPLCQLERRSAILGRRIEVTRPLDQMARNEKARVYTGVGPQGVDDKASWVFLLYDRSPLCKSFFSKYYILHRAGKFWGGDGRVFDALFGGDSIKDLEYRGRQVAQGKELDKSVKHDPQILDDMIARSNRAKFHAGFKDISKQIVGATELKLQKSKESK